MKTKKLLSVLSAAAVSATMLSGLALTASAAAGDTVNINYFADNLGGDYSVKMVNGSLRENSNTFSIDSNVSDDIRALYDENVDGNVDQKYVANYYNFIGYHNGEERDVYVENVSLQPGMYFVYYLGNNHGIDNVELSASSNAVITIESSINISSGLFIYPTRLILTEPYTGTITFSKNPGSNNGNSYLPDCYSIKIVNADAKTQNDVIVASDIFRSANDIGTVHNDITSFSNYIVNEDCPANAIDSFGDDLSSAGFAYLSYTDGLDDYAYMEVTKAGTYAIDLLSENNTRTKIEFLDILTETAKASAVVSQVQKVATTDTSNDVNYHTSSTNVALDGGMYKVRISGDDSKYYSNFIAFALREVSEPQPETLNMKNEGVAEGTGANAETYATMFSAKVEDFNGTAKTVAVTSKGEEKSFDVEGTVLTDATAIYGLIVNGLNDADAEAVITFE